MGAIVLVRLLLECLCYPHLSDPLIESPLADLMFRKLGVFAVVVGALTFLFRKAKSFIDNEDESGLSV